MSIKGLSEEDLAMLTEAERAGLEDDEDEDTDGDDQDNDDADQDADDNDADEDGDDGKKKSDDDADSDADADGDDKGNDKDGDDDQITPPPAPLFKTDVPADIAAKREALDTKEDELDTKFEDGDITWAEHKKQMREITKERSALDKAELKAELANEAAQSQSNQTWADTAQSFVSEHPLVSKNETMWNSFDAVLRRITADVISKGGQPGRRELEKAYKQWTEDIGIQDAGTAKKDDPQSKKKNKTIVPPNLGKVPAATGNDTDDGKFAHLDRLAESDPIAYEQALMKMTDAQRDEYRQAG